MREIHPAWSLLDRRKSNDNHPCFGGRSSFLPTNPSSPRFPVVIVLVTSYLEEPIVILLSCLFWEFSFPKVANLIMCLTGAIQLRCKVPLASVCRGKTPVVALFLNLFQPKLGIGFFGNHWYNTQQCKQRRSSTTHTCVRYEV